MFRENFKTQNSNFYKDLDIILQSRLSPDLDNIDKLVKNIILDIIKKVDKALLIMLSNLMELK